MSSTSVETDPGTEVAHSPHNPADRHDQHLEAQKDYKTHLQEDNLCTAAHDCDSYSAHNPEPVNVGVYDTSTSIQRCGPGKQAFDAAENDCSEATVPNFESYQKSSLNNPENAGNSHLSEIFAGKGARLRNRSRTASPILCKNYLKPYGTSKDIKTSRAGTHRRSRKLDRELPLRSEPPIRRHRRLQGTDSGDDGMDSRWGMLRALGDLCQRKGLEDDQHISEPMDDTLLHTTSKRTRNGGLLGRGCVHGIQSSVKASTKSTDGGKRRSDSDQEQLSEPVFDVLADVCGDHVSRSPLEGRVEKCECKSDMAGTDDDASEAIFDFFPNMVDTDGALGLSTSGVDAHKQPDADVHDNHMNSAPADGCAAKCEGKPDRAGAVADASKTTLDAFADTNNTHSANDRCISGLHEQHQPDAVTPFSRTRASPGTQADQEQSYVPVSGDRVSLDTHTVDGGLRLQEWDHASSSHTASPNLGTCNAFESTGKRHATGQV
jgi:hypothetical protein